MYHDYLFSWQVMIYWTLKLFVFNNMRWNIYAINICKIKCAVHLLFLFLSILKWKFLQELKFTTFTIMFGINNHTYTDLKLSKLKPNCFRHLFCHWIAPRFEGMVFKKHAFPRKWHTGSLIRYQIYGCEKCWIFCLYKNEKNIFTTCV